MMKLLFVIDTLGSGGKERRFTELIKALVGREEIEVSIVVMSHDIHYTEIYNLGVEIIKIIRKTPKDLSVFRQFRLLIKSVQPDAVHCWESMTAVYLHLSANYLVCPSVTAWLRKCRGYKRFFNYHWLKPG
jgi:glycosyltransferase involved in cell wall biosynthesis